MKLAERLIALGFEPGLDFEARDDGAGPYLYRWMSARPQPSDAEIDAVPSVDLIAYADRARDAAEMAGIIVSGVPVKTNDRSKTLLTGARLRVEKNRSIITPFAAADGQSYPLSAETVIALSDAIGEYVARCFEVYTAVVAGVAGGAITTPAQIDARFAAIDPVF